MTYTWKGPRKHDTGGHAARGGERLRAPEVLHQGARQKACPHTLARGRGLGHSPFPVPDLRDQLLITFAQGWLLVCADLGMRGAGGGGREPGQQRREGVHGIIYKSWLEKQNCPVWRYTRAPQSHKYL